MDLSYPISVLESLEKLSETLSSEVKDDNVPREAPSMWNSDLVMAEVAGPISPMSIVAEYRLYGSYAMNVSELLVMAGRSHTPLIDALLQSGGIVTLGLRDPKVPWRVSDAHEVTIDNDLASGRLSVSPFFLPCTRLLFMATKSDSVVLAVCNSENTLVESVGDTFEIVLADTPVSILAVGDKAIQKWALAEQWERLALIGLTLGVVDRSYRIALDALWKGQQEKNILAGEQVAQFQLADNFIDRQAVEHLAYDAAIDAEKGNLAFEKAAMIRYSTSEMAQKCANRALHLASMFDESSLVSSKWLVSQAHKLRVYSTASECEVQMATAGLARGMSVE